MSLEDPRDARRWRYWKAWWMRSDDDGQQLPPEVTSRLELGELDDAMDAAIEAAEDRARDALSEMQDSAAGAIAATPQQLERWAEAVRTALWVAR